MPNISELSDPWEVIFPDTGGTTPPPPPPEPPSIGRFKGPSKDLYGYGNEVTPIAQQGMFPYEFEANPRSTFLQTMSRLHGGDQRLTVLGQDALQRIGQIALNQAGQVPMGGTVNALKWFWQEQARLITEIGLPIMGEREFLLEAGRPSAGGRWRNPRQFDWFDVGFYELRFQARDFFSQMRHRAFRIFFAPDVSSIMMALNAMDVHEAQLFMSPKLINSMIIAARAALKETFDKAIRIQDNSPGGWPDDYTALIMQCIESANIVVNGDARFLWVELDFEENFGYGEELAAGYHYGAMIQQQALGWEKNKTAGEDDWSQIRRRIAITNTGSPRVTLPYRNEPLRFPLPKRLKFFRSAIIQRQFVQQPTFWFPQEDLKYEPSWENTVAARSAYWGRNKGRPRAPVWLLLAFGTHYPPTIRSYPIVWEFYTIFQKYYMNILAEALNEILAVANAGVAYSSRLGMFVRGEYAAGRSTGYEGDAFPAQFKMPQNFRSGGRYASTEEIVAPILSRSSPQFQASYRKSGGKLLRPTWEGGVYKGAKPTKALGYLPAERTDQIGRWYSASTPREITALKRIGVKFNGVRIRMADGNLRVARTPAELENAIKDGGTIVRGRTPKGQGRKRSPEEVASLRQQILGARKAEKRGTEHKTRVGVARIRRKLSAGTEHPTAGTFEVKRSRVRRAKAPPKKPHEGLTTIKERKAPTQKRPSTARKVPSTKSYTPEELRQIVYVEIPARGQNDPLRLALLTSNRSIGTKVQIVSKRTGGRQRWFRAMTRRQLIAAQRLASRDVRWGIYNEALAPSITIIEAPQGFRLMRPFRGKLTPRQLQAIKGARKISKQTIGDMRLGGEPWQFVEFTSGGFRKTYGLQEGPSGKVKFDLGSEELEALRQPGGGFTVGAFDLPSGHFDFSTRTYTGPLYVRRVPLVSRANKVRGSGTVDLSTEGGIAQWVSSAEKRLMELAERSNAIARQNLQGKKGRQRVHNYVRSIVTGKHQFRRLTPRPYRRRKRKNTS